MHHRRGYWLAVTVAMLALGAPGIPAAAGQVERSGTEIDSPVPSPATSSGVGASSLAAAIGIPPGDLVAASMMGSDPRGAGIGNAPLGMSFPTQGPTFAILSTGDAALADRDNLEGNLSTTLGGLDTNEGMDITRVHFRIKAPPKARCASFDFAFLSEEFPEFVGSKFNDSFTAQLNDPTYIVDALSNTVTAPGNFAFDTTGQPIEVNSPFGWSAGTGTTYDGETPLLRATTPVTPRSTFDLYMSVADLGDSAWDSAVFLDNWSWSSDPGCVTGATIAEPMVLFVPGMNTRWNCTGFESSDGTARRFKGLQDKLANEFGMDPDSDFGVFGYGGSPCDAAGLHSTYQPVDTCGSIDRGGHAAAFREWYKQVTAERLEVHVVTHSMGGLVAGDALTGNWSPGNLASVTTLDSPMAGQWRAFWVSLIKEAGFFDGCPGWSPARAPRYADMTPASGVIKRIRDLDVATARKFANVGNTLDLVVAWDRSFMTKAWLNTRITCASTLFFHGCVFTDAAAREAVINNIRANSEIFDVQLRCKGREVTLPGTGAPDVIRGSRGADVAWGGGAADVIMTFGGPDTACGGPGVDSLMGGPGDDELLGEGGRDTIWGGGGGDIVSGGAGWDTLYGGPGEDDLRGGRGLDGFFGGTGFDTCRGSPLFELLVGCEA